MRNRSGEGSDERTRHATSPPSHQSAGDGGVTLPPLPLTNLLIADRPLLVLPRLVAFVGLNEAIVLQQIRYWLADDLRPQVRDGRRWVYNTYEAWHERNFPFWSVATVKRTFGSLERQGLLNSANYNASRRDHTKWYTVNFDRLIELDQLYRAAHGQSVGRTNGVKRSVTTVALPVTDLLLDEEPLLLLPKLATRIGFDEALVLQQVRYWLGDRRAPLVRDGRRWCRCPLHRWHEQFPFRSAPTINRALRTLIGSGLLLTTAAYNHGAGDRTLWYTIDFARVAALELRLGQATGGSDNDESVVVGQQAHVTDLSAPLNQNEPNQLIKMNQLSDQQQQLPDHFAPPEMIILPRPFDRHEPADPIDLRPSIKEPEINAENQPEIKKQQRSAGQPMADTLADDVVVIDVQRMIEDLVTRGITRSVAARLAARYPQSKISAHSGIFDRQREDNPDDARFTPGRLRRMIEEDWTPPPGYFANDRLDNPIAPEVINIDRHASETQTRRQTIVAEATEHRQLLERVGLVEADQALWARLAQQSPPLPTPFRTAFFHAPVGHTQAAAVIFPDSSSLMRALGPAHAATRATVAARVAALCYSPGARVVYLDLPTVCGQLGIEAPSTTKWCIR